MPRPLPTTPVYNAHRPTPAPPSPPPLVHLDTPPQAYDHNFAGGPLFPLSTDRCLLVPFVPSIHARAYHAAIAGGKEMLRYMPYAPDPTASLENLCEVIETRIRRDEGTCLFAIFDLDRCTNEAAPPCAPPPLFALAGVIGLLNVSRVNLIGEIGHVVILPAAQRTHVLSHAAALLMHYALDLHTMGEWDEEARVFGTPAPAAELAMRRPLGLRRLQWQAHALNAPSIRAAQRLGFRAEGIARCQRVVPGRPPLSPGADAATDVEDDARLFPARAGDGVELPSRDSWVGAITWQDWESEVRGQADALVAR